MLRNSDLRDSESMAQLIKRVHEEILIYTPTALVYNKPRLQQSHITMEQRKNNVLVC